MRDMKSSLKVLFVGESVIAHAIEFKGYDQFTATRYHESAKIMRKVFEESGHEFHHVPCHLVSDAFPTLLSELQQYDAVFLSDVGSNTMLLHPDTARFCKRTVNTLKL